jgi:hypothetical protein
MIATSKDNRRNIFLIVFIPDSYSIYSYAGIASAAHAAGDVPSQSVAVIVRHSMAAIVIMTSIDGMLLF